jgi:uncharacterized protein (DUF1800 family)
MGDRMQTTFGATLVASLWALSGCTEGGENGPPENSLAAQEAYSEEDIDHMLMRAEFGIDETERTEMRTMGLAAYVDQMLDFPTTGTSAVETAAFAYLVNSGDPAGLEGKFPSTADISDWWLYLMLHSEHPFQERLALFWHDHFAISYTALRSDERFMMVDYINKLRRLGIGNFKTLVLELARDAAMLEWLDGSSNIKTEPNENFAREFFELFTVGADRGYTEADIQEAARAFTGYRNRLDSTSNLRYHEFDSDRKDVGAKVLFDDVILRNNVATVDDYDLVVDATFTHLDVASWLAEKLLLEFVTDDPNPQLIANLAAVIRRNDYEMKPILRSLFLSSAFYLRKREIIRMPIDYGIGLVRATGLMVEPDDIRAELTSLAQLPGDPPSVFGWPQGSEWLSAAGMVERANLARRLIGERTFQSNNNYAVAMPSGTPDAAAVVDHFAALMAVRLSDEERTTLITYLDSHVLNNGDVQVDAFDPADPQDINNRVRGLIYILANHPDALRR